MKTLLALAIGLAMTIPAQADHIPFPRSKPASMEEKSGRGTGPAGPRWYLHCSTIHGQYTLFDWLNDDQGGQEIVLMCNIAYWSEWFCEDAAKTVNKFGAGPLGYGPIISRCSREPAPKVEL